LAADRFKERDCSLAKSPTEQLILKKLRQKNPAVVVVKPVELVDLWATPVEVKSKHGLEYEAFASQQMTKVRAVILPEGG